MFWRMAVFPLSPGSPCFHEGRGEIGVDFTNYDLEEGNAKAGTSKPALNRQGSQVGGWRQGRELTEPVEYSLS